MENRRPDHTPAIRRGEVVIDISERNDLPPPRIRRLRRGGLQLPRHRRPVVAPGTTTPWRNWVRIRNKINAGAIVIMFPPMVTLVQVKFQNSKQSPFETYSHLFTTTLVAYGVAIATSILSFYMRDDHSENMIKKGFYVFIQCVSIFSAILAPLMLLLVLVLPHGV